MLPRAMIVATLLGAMVASLPALARASERIDAIFERGRITLGYIPGQRPFSDTPGEGFAVDVCRAVAARLTETLEDVEIEFVETPLGTALDAVEQGEVDLLCGALSLTFARRERVEFSLPFFLTGTTAILRADGPPALASIAFGSVGLGPSYRELSAALDGRKLGFRRGSITATRLAERLAEQGLEAELVGFETHDAALEAILAGSLDAYLGDRRLLAEALAGAGFPQDLQLANRLFSTDAYAIALARDDSDWRLAVDRALASFVMSDGFYRLMERYFRSEVDLQLGLVRGRMP